ncbi:hypothetical protein [Microbacterium allomyrinae]|uniref:Uncharacterized protein n=1 Tax=Microbacterium allomyrinae TaxID=2830666 RepID=A0A9X1LU94_9MICO|nr:hypothetical protein [Microbacterium allomyrinae]MCC2031806.1 hypothetical protein [Microbacterium allomyrinae]
MSKTMNRASYQVRWYIRQETTLVPFGTANREAIVWVAYRTTGRDSQGRPRLLVSSRTSFSRERGGRAAAFRYARNEARRFYGNAR